ncbi:MAG: shikimate dehydrogenase [Betaproteobacteria bacterium]|nr:shikimate dehydrogenase [Betaproteobacteria bacterium]
MPHQFAVIGNPISHSRSPDIHALFAQQSGIELTYERVLAEPGAFGACVAKLRARGFRGSNVTLPFKEDALGLATELTDRARRAGAVNTLTFRADAILGDNTDGAGLLRDLTHNLKFSLAGRRVLILGAGGAARGVLHPLVDAQPADLVIANRTFARAAELAALDQGAGRTRAARFEDLNGPAFDLIINATSASVQGGVPPIPAHCLAQHTLAYDMMYGGQPTAFMNFASNAGARTADGLGMLVEQAAEAFFVWHGVRPETASVLATLRQRLAA